MANDLENLLTTLETSKRLKELGVKQNSKFYYVDLHFSGARGKDIKPYPMYYGGKIMGKQCYPWDEGDLYKNHWIASAFMAAEIPLPFPYSFVVNTNEYILFDCQDSDTSSSIEQFKTTNLSEAHGLAWIYLLEHKLAKVEDLHGK